jgi:hypothetical protein
MAAGTIRAGLIAVAEMPSSVELTAASVFCEVAGLLSIRFESRCEFNLDS